MPFLLAIFMSGFAQGDRALRFDRITTENIISEKGLSQNSGYSILQDSRGFMWFGTWDGLNKYDGYDFTVYNKETGLSNTTINTLAEDDQGHLWIGTDDGLNNLDLLTGEISVFKHAEGDPNTLSNNFVTHLNIDSQSLLWISTSNGLNSYNKEKDVFRAYKFFSGNVDSSITNYISSTYQDRDGYLWIATRHGLHKYDLADRSFSTFYHDEENQSGLSGNNVLSILQDSDGHSWHGTTTGLTRYQPEPGKYSWIRHQDGNPQSISNDRINVLFEESPSTLWIGTADQLNILARDEMKITRYMSTYQNTSISNDDILSIFRDLAGTIWIGTYMGINKVDEHPSRFTHYHYSKDNPDCLSNNIVYSMKEDSDGLLWIATYNGVNILDRKNNTFNYLKHDKNNHNSLESNKLKVVYIDSHGYYWFGTENHGLNRYDKSSGQFTLFDHDPDDSTSLSDNSVLSMIEDRYGRLWVGSGHGIDIFDPATQSFRNLKHDPLNSTSLSNDRIWTMYEDSKGFIWIGTDFGLNKLDSTGKCLGCYTHDLDAMTSISGNRIFSIYEDVQGIFWIGTMGAGLNRFNPETGEFKSYTEQDGLSNNVVYASLEDEDGNLWLSTNWGLSKFNKVSESFVNYDVNDGVQGKEFNNGSYFRNAMGEMFFGGMNGLTIFHPEEVKTNERIPTIVITGFRVFNEPIRGTYDNGDTIRLTYDDNFFAFEFSALDYTNPAKNMFRYQLENYDMGWTLSDATHRVAEYKKVSSGTYVFRVIGANNDGIWNVDGVSLTVIITPPWWETWAFRVPFALLLITGFWVVIYTRFKNIKHKHESDKIVLDVEKQIFELEQRALRLQMNPHFIFNSLNAIQSYVISDDAEKAVPFMAKFSHLMRMILANSTESFISLKDDLKALRLYLDIEQMRFEDKFDYVLHIDPDVDEEFIEIPPMILQPYVENAILHGLNNRDEKGLLEVIVKRQRDSLFCILQDNGIGRDEARMLREKSGIRRQSKGMVITKERVDLLRRQFGEEFAGEIIDLKNGGGKAAGTRVEIHFEYREIS